MHYKDPQNNLYGLESADDEHFLPSGCVRITDDEAAAISASQVIPLTYIELRAAAYPPFTDFLDSVVKSDSVARQKYIDDCLAVKAKYPKPGQS